jgi:AraC-like DNA-binding protein
MLAENKMSIASIAVLLTYDPSNFTKFFKRYTGKTPKQFREEILNGKTESLTI